LYYVKSQVDCDKKRLSKGGSSLVKHIQYKRWEFAKNSNKVAYAIVGKNCYFTGTEKENRMSTINAAEYIIKAITEQEKISVKDYRFFDLQTHRGYSKAQGVFELDELILDFSKKSTCDSSNFVVSMWMPAKCSDEVRKIFQEYIN
jgi:hypothetical protein